MAFPTSVEEPAPNNCSATTGDPTIFVKIEDCCNSCGTSASASFELGDSKKETKNYPSDSNDSRESFESRRYLGIFLAFFAALKYSISALIVKLIGYHPYNLGVWRFSSMIFITLPFLIHGQFVRKSSSGLPNTGIFSRVWPPNKTTGLLLLQAILGSNSIMFVFYGLSYLDIGDSIVIGTSAPVFVTIVAWIFLRERCGVISVLTAIIAMFGVAIICKPPILTGNTQLDLNTLKGVSFSLASMILLTFCYVLIRHLRKVHHALIQFTFAIWGLLESVFMACVLNVLALPGTWYEVGLILANSVLAFSAQTCITLALKYEQAGVVALVRTTEVVFCYFWQALFLHVQPDIFSVVGAVITLSCVVLAALRKTLMSLPDNHESKKRFSYLLL